MLINNVNRQKKANHFLNVSSLINIFPSKCSELQFFLNFDSSSLHNDCRKNLEIRVYGIVICDVYFTIMCHTDVFISLEALHKALCHVYCSCGQCAHCGWERCLIKAPWGFTISYA